MRDVVIEVLTNPIVSDSFGFSEKETAYIFLLFFVGPMVAMVLQ